MPRMRILCWNVNGVRAVARKGLLEWLDSEAPDILCLQETKASPDQLETSLRQPAGYYVYWNSPERTGYSGVATFTRDKPLTVRYGLDVPELDGEGRLVLTEHPGFTLLNVYFPNGKKDAVRLQYKMDFYEAFLAFTDGLRAQGRKLVVCGDFNTAHREIDLARPKKNEKTSGFLPMEREWIDRFIAHGYVDTFRHFNSEPQQYTWWDLKSRARQRNVGWRIDYFFVSQDLLPSVTEAFIMPDVMGSDHCPVGLTLETP
ncbi:MAG: exodeoxyribonuclease III [Chloroflexota bacterium]|nr:exodeoxyribonuclease III [Chloroflexota bacterium]